MIRTNITLLCVIIPALLTGIFLHIGSRIVTRFLHEFTQEERSSHGRELRGPTHDERDVVAAAHINIASSVRVVSPFRLHPPPSTPFKIFIYDMPEEFNNLIRRENHKCASSMFASEVALHTWLLHNKDIRTFDINKADLYYVPAYTTCQSTAFAGNGPDPWAGKELMSKAINWVQVHYPDQWKKKRGRDHVFSAVHDYGSCFDFQRERAHKTGPLEDLKNSIVLMSLGDTKSPCYNAKKDVIIPSFIPSLPATAIISSDAAAAADLLQANWHMYLGNEGPTEDDEDANVKSGNELMHLPAASRAVPGNRKILVFFWGQLAWTDAGGKVDTSYSHGIRQNLKRLYKSDPLFVMHHVTREGAGSLEFQKYSGLLDRSVFCLSPAGFAPWTKRLYEVIMHGCIPIIIADVLIMPFEKQLDWSKFSIRISENDLATGKLKGLLTSLSKNKIVQMQQTLADMKEAMVYRFPTSKQIKTTWSSKHGKGNNAFDYIMRELSEKSTNWAK